MMALHVTLMGLEILSVAMEISKTSYLAVFMCFLFSVCVNLFMAYIMYREINVQTRSWATRPQSINVNLTTADDVETSSNISEMTLELFDSFVEKVE
jgi:hypothetical protein